MPRVALWLLILTALPLASCGHQERTISITSEPPGALVWLNDRELGRTPVETEFKFFGDYDVRLTLEGYEPLITHKNAEAPIWEYPVIDLVAVMIPGTRRTKLEWHFDLAKRGEELLPADTTDAALIARGKELRGRVRVENEEAGNPVAPPLPTIEPDQP